jgi:putative ABC transport system permease protein
MVKNYFKIAFRSLSKNRFYTALNIVGLSIGLFTGLLILLWVKDELSFDRYHPNADLLYRENTHLKIGDKVQVLETCPAPHAAYALREIPEVEKAVRVVKSGTALIVHGEAAHVEKRGVFADTSFFQVFQTNMLAGNVAQPFGDMHSIVLTESFARKYFEVKDNLTAIPGQVLQIDNEPVVVSAVIADFPGNTLFQYDYIRPYEYLKARFQSSDLWKSREEDWGNCDDATYFRLRPGTDISAVQHKLTDLTHAHNPLDRGTFYTLQPFTQVHLYGADGSDSGAQMVRILSMVALFILLIACINYINLATAKATKRAQEVGLRKAIGASRRQLIVQFLIESCLVFFISSVLALLLTYNLLPWCNEIADKKLRIDWSDPGIPLLMTGVLGSVLLLSALYPAFILSSFQPSHTMKGQAGSGKDGQARLRKGLVVIQFMCSSALLLAMFVISRQVNFIQTKNLGYDRENVFQINLSDRTYENRDAILQELRTSPGVLEATAASASILQNRILTGDTEWDGKSPDNMVKFSPMAVAPGYLSFFNMTLVAGKDFTGSGLDASSFIINETAAAQMGTDNPVGKRFKLWDTEGTVIGVVKDFHFSSLRTAIKPAVFYTNPQRLGVICVKTTSQDAPKAIAAAATVWKRFDAAYPFEYAFMDDAFDNMYRQEQRTSQLFRVFGGIALLISCLGLLGLSAFTVEQRTKEIGIRKVLGASVSNITGLLTKDFIALVLIAFLIASPLAYWTMNKWLADFAYRIDMEWWMFAAVGIIAMAIAFLTVSAQTIRAALIDPVKSLHNE